jgi:indolepyruvate ferredoxin oxidoreductase alpha subunit
MMRITTRLAHSRASVGIINDPFPEKKLSLPVDPVQFVLLPAFARKKYRALLSTYDSIRYDARIEKYNSFSDGTDRTRGIITCCIAYNYLM